jgi:dTMP kinase
MFITFEGSEGCGKSTQIARLAAFLEGAGYPVLLTREPGGTPISEQIRTVIMDLKNTAMQPRTEILLLQAARAQLVEEIIRPHLENGGLVLCDRYADSTLAYQGYGYQLFDLDTLRTIIRFATDGLQPDLTVLFDMDVEQGLRRRVQGGEWNRLDAMDLSFYQRVRQGYLEMAQAEQQRWEIVDASEPVDQIQDKVRQIVLERLQAKIAHQNSQEGKV